MRRLVVLAASLVALALGATAGGGQVGRSMFADPLTGGEGQHASVVEPDTFAWGDTVVATFQVGRRVGGGADAIGWATSGDGGRTWRSGLLPGLTPATGGQTAYSHASDPAVAYDRVHGVWLASVLALQDGPGSDPVSAIVVSRSRDGLEWSDPVVTSPSTGVFAHDKNWIACDNGDTSRFAGRCYTAWSTSEDDGRLAVATSTDGGLTWSNAVVTDVEGVVGVQPVTRPDGVLVVPYLRENRLESVRSTDGAASFEAPVEIAEVLFSPVASLRAAALPSVEVAGDGRIWLAWPDCRFQPVCRPGSSTNDIALVSSADGRRWSIPRRVPLGPLNAELDFVAPGLAVDAATSGARTRLAVSAYALGPSCTDLDCGVSARAVLSANAGATWTAPRTIAPTTRLADVPLSGRAARMLGDYLSTSWASGAAAVPVVTAPVAPFDGVYHVDAIAARLAAPPSAVLSVRPAAPRAGALVRATLSVVPAPAATRVRCSVRLGSLPLRVVARTGARGRASCAWRIPRASAGRTLQGAIALGAVRRTFSYRVARAATARR